MYLLPRRANLLKRARVPPHDDFGSEDQPAAVSPSARSYCRHAIAAGGKSYCVGRLVSPQAAAARY